MNPKSLVNVLIKILGLSVVVHDIPSLLTGLINIVRESRFNSFGSSHGSWIFLLPYVLSLAIGAGLIIKSRAVTEWLLKNEAE
jgi:hypothetical protein